MSRTNLSDAPLDKMLNNLLVWSESVKGQKTKPSQIQLGSSLLTGIIEVKHQIASNPGQYNKLLDTLKIVLENLEAKEYSPAATGVLQRLLRHALGVLHVKAQEQHAQTKVWHDAIKPAA